MTFVRLLPVILSTLLAAAHLLRASGLPMALGLVLLLGTLAIRRELVRRLWQVGLVGFALMWVSTAVDLIGVRRAAGEPWERLAAILFGVAAFTLLSALSLSGRRISERFRGEERAQ